MSTNSKSPFLITSVLVFLSVLSLGFSIYLFASKPKIAYVYNAKVLTEYKGLKEGKALYDKKLQNWQANLDTLGKDLSREIQEFQANSSKLSAKDKVSKEAALRKKEQDLYNYKQAIENKAKEEERQMSSALINQVNNYIMDFGKSKDYDYIFGVTDNGNLLFAREGDDITADVIKSINDKYAGEK